MQNDALPTIFVGNLKTGTAGKQKHFGIYWAYELQNNTGNRNAYAGRSECSNRVKYKQCKQVCLQLCLILTSK